MEYQNWSSSTPDLSDLPPTSVIECIDLSKSEMATENFASSGNNSHDTPDASEIPGMPLSSVMEKKLDAMKGLTRDQFAENVQGQIKNLPPSRVFPESSQAVAARIGKILLKCEEIRIKVRVGMAEGP